jgi:predicted alpha/beta-hydrolase family hydrolase
MNAQSSKFLVSPVIGEVSALLIRPENAAALLVFAHGAGTDMRHPSMESLSRSLATRGIGTFRYNFPYKEHGSGRPDKLDVATATVRAAVAAAAQAAPGLPLFAGGRSFGGRMTSNAAAEAPLPGVRGVIFYAFPLHAAGKPGTQRAEHLAKVAVPMLFLNGPRDELATPELLEAEVKKLGRLATLHPVAAADHSFKVLKSSGRKDEDVQTELLDATQQFMKENS